MVSYSNTLIWILAFAPFLGLFLQGFMSGISGINVGHLWIVPIILNTFLAYQDSKQLDKAGVDISEIGAYWLIPVYMYNRSKHLGESFVPFGIWCVCFFLIIFC